MKRPIICSCVLMLAVALLCAKSVALGQSLGQDRMKQLYEANDLSIEGHPPLRLHLNFQLYDLKGKPSEQGAIEMYGAPGKNKHLVFHAASLKDSGEPTDDSPFGAREAYLVSELVTMVLNPVPKPGSGTSGAQEISRKFGKLVLECVSPNMVTPTGFPASESLFCSESKKDAVRFISKLGGFETISRNSIGLFHGTNVALDVELAYADLPAIGAKVTTLESIDPATIEEPQSANLARPTPPATAVALAEPRKIAGGIMVGMRTKFVQPEYPGVAKAGHMTGSVLLHAIIATDGSVKHLVPIASNDPVFTESAMAAVSQWMYRPYMLNGAPSEVETTITVNFALRH